MAAAFALGRGGYGTFPTPENIALKAADKTWAGYYFGVEDCSL